MADISHEIQDIMEHPMEYSMEFSMARTLEFEVQLDMHLRLLLQRQSHLKLQHLPQKKKRKLTKTDALNHALSVSNVCWSNPCILISMEMPFRDKTMITIEIMF